MKKSKKYNPAKYLTPKEKAAFILIMVRMHTLNWNSTYQHPMSVSRAKAESLGFVDLIRSVAPSHYRVYWGRVKKEMMKMNLDHEEE